jgi:predicted RNase H-like nuclease (RuvC/YqgF family)
MNLSIQDFAAILIPMVGMFWLLWHRINNLEAKIEAKIDKLDKRIDETNKRIDETNKRIDDLERRLTRIEDRLEFSGKTLYVKKYPLKEEPKEN